MNNRKKSKPRQMVLSNLGKHWKAFVIGMIITMVFLILAGYMMGPDKMWKPINKPAVETK